MKTAMKPILTLALICLCGTLLLALTNAVTAPAIAAAEAAAEKEALRSVCPDAADFVTLADLPALPRTVTAVYRDDAETTYIFRLETAGYAPGIKILCAIGADGRIRGVKTLSTNETDGYGKRCENSDYTEQYTGVDGTLSGVDALSGATKTTHAYEAAIKDAFKAFDLLNGGKD